MKNFLLLALLPLYCIALNAQNITGRIVDDRHNPLDYINIVLKNNTDSSFVSGVVTTEDGKFVIKGEHGDYSLVISGVGYKTKEMRLDSQPKDTLNLGEIVIYQESYTLAEVVVKGKQKPLVQRRGEYALNVSSTDLKKQPDVLSIMSFLPFTVKSGDNIAVMGKGQPLFYINGREVKSMAEITRLKPEQIKDIVLDTHPSAQYASQYNAIIHINTITPISDYFSSQINHTSTVGRKYSDNQSLDVNFKKGKWYNYISYAFLDRHIKESATNSYTVYDAMADYSLLGKNYSENTATNMLQKHRATWGTTYTPNSNNLFDFQYSFENYRTTTKANTLENSTLNGNQTSLTTFQNSIGKGTTHDLSLLYRHTRKSSSLDVNTGFIYGQDNPIGNILTNNTTPTNLTGNNTYKVFMMQTDYKLNLPKEYEIIIGGRFSHTNNNGSSSSENPNTGISKYNDRTTLTDENYSLYANVNRQMGNLYAGIGLRWEYMNSIYKLNAQELVKDKSSILYPSVELEYEISPSVGLLAGYTAKSLRPSISQLSPILKYVNSLLYEKGNPALKTMKSHNIYLSAILLRKISIELNYDRKIDFPMYVMHKENSANEELINSPINTNVSYYTLRTSYSDKFGFYRFSYNASVHYDLTRIPFLGAEGEKNKPQFSLSTVNQFDIDKNTMLFCNFNIASSYCSLGTRIGASYDLSIGLYRTFFADKRLTVILSGNDLLAKKNPNSVTFNYTIMSEKFLSPDSRNITLSIRYNLNNFKSLFKKNSSGDIDRRRIGR